MNRFKGQMEILKEKKPDIVVLQEVTADYVDALLSKVFLAPRLLENSLRLTISLERIGDST